MATPVFLSARIRGIGLGLGLIALLLSAPSPVWGQSGTALLSDLPGGI